MKKSTFILLIGIFFTLTSCDTVKQFVDDTTSGNSTNSETKGPRVSSKSYQNTMDSLKMNSPELVTKVKNGKLQEGVTIKFNSGKTLRGGEIFQPSEYTHGWINPSNGFTNLFKDSKGQKVTIQRTGKPDMYGILEFNEVYESCSTLPATRSYYIRIPESYFNDAQGGNITSLYEYYECEPTAESGKNYYTTWAIWISDVPF